METNFVLVFTTAEAFKAEIAKEILDDNDIKCVVMNQQDSVIPSIGEIEIYVHENDLELALDILKKLKN
ncbi:putative signal transducing protein [Mangrovibacterium diazotrophicum]|uniref:Putative signal transducing protein n=1 Tax=Mangrovibacterium diazotrophicum TaxID=1261403 RepID=A0A419W7D8_9BACT|nr:DUF2007 domain-containing protein [Mangrovibacterium diazotrophicum]RKD91397.1 putative signal transducing protein [Mangrovibacterium diazotrophicum]